MTVHSHCVESFEGLLQRCGRGRGCSEFLKNTFFPEHPVSPSPLSHLQRDAGWLEAIREHEPAETVLRQDRQRRPGHKEQDPYRAIAAPARC